MKFTLLLCFIFSLLHCSLANAANVIWDCFEAMEFNVSSIGSGVSIYFYDNVTPELAFIYEQNKRGNIISATATGDYCNLGYPISYWVIANAGDILISKEDFLSKEILYNQGYPDMPYAIDGATLSTSPPQTYYLAILGDNYGADNWYAWVEVQADASGLSVLNAAFSYDTPLIVGGGAIPEPTSRILTLVGSTMLLLFRKRHEA